MVYEFIENRFVPINGIIANNRGFLYGDGFFETMLILNGRPTFWRERLVRISGTLSYLKITLNGSFNDLYQALTSVAGNESGTFQRARLSFIRSGAGKYRPEVNECDIFLQLESVDEIQFSGSPIKNFDMGKLKIPSDVAGNFKLIGKHYQVLAALEAEERNVDDLVLLNNKDEICETISGNVFALTDGQFITPNLSSGCLNGVIRNVLLQNNLCIEDSMSLADIQNSEALFSTNSISGITQLVKNGTKTVGSDKVEGLKTKLNQLLLNSTRDPRGSQP